MKPSSLKKRINAVQMEQLVADAKAMVLQYKAEMEAKYYPKRREYERQSNNDFEFRRRITAEQQPQRIFDLSNYTLNIVRNVTRFMKARCGEDLFGSKPWFSAMPVGLQGDPALADQINRHAPWKLGQAQYTKIGKEGIGLALDLGECVLKTTHRTEMDYFESPELVLCNKRTGKPVVIGLKDEAGEPRLNEKGEQEGDYIYPEDGTQKAENGTVCFEKAPEIAFDETVEFREVLIEEEEERYHGLDAANVRFDAFIAPLNVATLAEADCCAHEFTRKYSQLKALYATEENKILFEQLMAEPDGPKTAEDKPRETYGEVASGRQRIQMNPDIKVQEIYLRGYDVFGDGKGRNVFLVIAADLDEPLYVEYLANITVKGKLPFHSIAVNRVPQRWHGRGFYEIYATHQELIDALANAILYRNENNSDPLVCWQPDATEEGKSEKRLVRRPGKTITLRAGKTAKDAVEIISFPDLDQRTYELMQLIIQLVQTDSGVTSAAQGDYSALPSASTATGVSSILQSASTLHRMLTEDLKDGYEPAVLFGIETLYAKQNKDETFKFLEGAAEEILSLASARTLAALEMNVRILLTRFQMREQREQAQLIITNILPAWVQTLQASGLPTAELAQRARPLFIQVAKGCDIQQAEEIFALPQAAPPQQDPAPSARISESMNYKDAPPDVRRQMEQAAGFEPSKMGDQPQETGAAPEKEPAAPSAQAAPEQPLPANVIPSPRQPSQEPQSTKEPQPAQEPQSATAEESAEPAKEQAVEENEEAQ